MGKPCRSHWFPRLGFYATTAGSWTAPWNQAMLLYRDAIDFRGRLCIACGRPLPWPRSRNQLYCCSTCLKTQEGRRRRLRAFLVEWEAPCPVCSCREHLDHDRVNVSH